MVRTVRASASGRRRRHGQTKIVLLKISPEYPKDNVEKQTLGKYLEKIGCSRLLTVPWGIFDHKALATELIGEPDNRYDGSLRAHSEHWTADF